jgi:hypothetical protein
VSQVALEFVYVVNAPCTPLSVLTIDRFDSESPRSHAKYEGVLTGVTYDRN